MLNSDAPAVRLQDHHPAQDQMRAEVLRGLGAPHKNLPCKYFYDRRGSRLFDAICELPEYYLTRTELGIMNAHVKDMAAALGPDLLLLEPGSGSGIKTQLLLESLARPVAYVPVDISRSHLLDSAQRLSARFPQLEVLPVCADFNGTFSLPAPRRPARRTAVYFPGSTLGNFGPAEAAALLRRLKQLAGTNGALLVGFDMQKDQAVLERAYNDAAGVTAEFNRNLLARLNRELGADFDLSRFRHTAVYDAVPGRIEMRLASRGEQRVHVAGEHFGFRDGESIVTEHSYKYTAQSFAALATQAGLAVEKTWQDEKAWFSVAYLCPLQA
ncbi:MAG TPA: L-histidine N(alpha)-methyltransferase [Gammaproteobacteria bacterium]|nr:L-histidine N(alpha)-methyltransferase [Gammaproteobacteria bacterium]